MTLTTCLRCDWHGDSPEPTCPQCGARPLYVVPTNTAASRTVSNHEPSLAEAQDPPVRSAARAGAFVLAALVLMVALGARLNAHVEPQSPVTATYPRSPDTRVGASSLAPSFARPTGRAHLGTQALTVGGEIQLVVESVSLTRAPLPSSKGQPVGPDLAAERM